MVDDPARSRFAVTLTEAIRRSGLTLESLRVRLAAHDIQVSVATLSYWQNGRSQPTRAHSIRTLTALERILSLEPGELVSTAPVAPTRSRGAIASRSGIELPRTVEEALELSGMSTRNLRKVSTHLTVTLASDRTQSSEVVRNIVQCLVAGTSSFPIVVESEAGQIQEVHGLSNCTKGRTWPLQEQNLVLTEMLLPRPLRQGELLMLEYMTTIGEGGESVDSIAMAQPRLSEMVVEVQFPLDQPPQRAAAYTRTIDEDPEFAAEDLVELPVSEGCAQVVKLDVQPAIHVLRWEW